jgi:acyl-CoA thioester hydrolase
MSTVMRFPLATRYADYDTKGHVNNAVYLTYFEIAREHAWLEAMGQTVDYPIVIAEARVKYVSQAMIGDPLAIELSVGEVRTKAWTFRYRIVDARDERLVAEGETVQVYFDYDARRPAPIPEPLRARLLTLVPAPDDAAGSAAARDAPAPARGGG